MYSQVLLDNSLLSLIKTLIFIIKNSDKMIFSSNQVWLSVKYFDNKPIGIDVCPSVFTTLLYINTLVHFRVISSVPYLNYK